MQEAAFIKSRDSAIKPRGATGRMPPGVILARFFSTAGRRAAVVLGFTIPISTTATEAVLGFLVVCWLFSGDYAVRFQMIRRSRVAVLALVLFAVYAIAVIYSSAPLSEATRTLFTYRKLLCVPIFLTVFADPRGRKHGICAFSLAMLVTLGASFLVSLGVLESLCGDITGCAYFKNYIAQNTLMALFVAVLISHGCPKPRLRWLYVGVILLAVYNIFFMVAGRVGYVVFFALVFLWMYRLKGFRGLLLALVVLSCAGPAVYFCSSRFHGRVSKAFQEVVDYYGGDTGFAASGDWFPYSGLGFEDDFHYSFVGDGSGAASWSFTVTPGQYKVAATWAAHPNRATNAPYEVYDGVTDLDTVPVNQRVAPDDFSDRGAAWETLGTFTIRGGTLLVELSDNADGLLIADAVRIERLGDLPPAQIIDDGLAVTPQASVGQRLLFYQTALRIASRSPLVGMGTGSLQTEFRKSLDYKGIDPTSNTHNEYLSILIQTGLIGFCLLLWWICAQWKCSNQLPPELASLAQATIVVMVVASLFNSILSSTAEGWIYCYFISLCCGGILEAPPAAQPIPNGSRFAHLIGIA